MHRRSAENEYIRSRTSVDSGVDEKTTRRTRRSFESFASTFRRVDSGRICLRIRIQNSMQPEHPVRRPSTAIGSQSKPGGQIAHLDAKNPPMNQNELITEFGIMSPGNFDDLKHQRPFDLQESKDSPPTIRSFCTAQMIAVSSNSSDCVGEEWPRSGMSFYYTGKLIIAIDFHGPNEIAQRLAPVFGPFGAACACKGWTGSFRRIAT